MTYKEIILLVSKELNLPSTLIDNVYKTYWKSIKDMIQELPLKLDISFQEFSKLKTNYNIPSLGKLYIDWNKLLGKKERYIKLKREKNK